LRINNHGHGVANSVNIESAQPKIVENEQGLAIDFTILSSYFQDQPANPSLLINFGDIQPQTSVTGRWIMQSSQSGKFIDFQAGFTHADRLGGELTSLLTGTEAHRLIRDVMVDINGRDRIKDFLAYEQDKLFVYESENTNLNTEACDDCIEVSPQQGTLTAISVGNYQFTFATTGPVNYAKAVDPHNGAMLISQVLRADGSVLKPENSWLSKTRADDKQTFDYFVNVFDSQSTGDYTIQFVSQGDVLSAKISAANIGVATVGTSGAASYKVGSVPSACSSRSERPSLS
jgi:hypothetical protein